MSRIERKTFEGIFVPDRLVSRETLWAAQSSYSQAGLTVGIPVPQRPTAMALQASGTIDDDDDVLVTCTRSGMPGPEGAGVIRQAAAGSATASYGWQPPKAIMGSEVPVAWDGYSKTNPHLIALEDDTAVMVYHYVGLTTNVRAVVRSTAGTWSSPNNVRGLGAAISTLTNYDSRPCLCLGQDGILLCAYWVERDGDTAADFMQVEISASSDGGTTWDVAATDVLPSGLTLGGSTPYDPTYSRLRLAWKDGQYLLIVSIRKTDTTYDHEAILIQYAATSLSSFTLVAESAGNYPVDNGAGYPDVVVHRGRFLIGYIGMDSVTSTITTALYLRSIANAYQDLRTVEAVVINAASDYGVDTQDGATTAFYLSDGDFALAILNEALYAYTRLPSGSGEHRMFYSADDGASWRALAPYQSGDGGRWYYTGSTAVQLANFSAVAQGGRMLVATNMVGAASNEDETLVLGLGGWSQTTLPVQRGGQPRYLEAPSCWETTFLPANTAANQSAWSGGTTGTASVESVNTVSGYQRLQTTVTNTRSYQRTFSASAANRARGVMVMMDLAYVSGTVDATANVISAWVSLSDGVNRVWVQVVLGSAAIHVKDLVASSDLSTTSITTTNRTQILLAVAGSVVSVWYRQPTAGADALQGWTNILDSEGLTQGASATASIAWGHLVGGSDTVESRWWGFHDSQAATFGKASGMASDYFNPESLNPGPITSSGTNLGDGLVVSAVTGEALTDDSWEIPREWDYALTNILPQEEPSRAIGWRSLADNTQMDIAFDRQVGATDPLVGDCYGLLLWQINFRYLTLYRYVGGVAASVATIDAAEGLDGLTYEMDGDTVRPTASTSGRTRWIARNELAGGTFVDDAGNRRRIIANDPGTWADVEEYPYPRLYLDPDGVTGTEDRSGTAGAIWAPNVYFFVRQNVDGGYTFESLRLRITAQQTVDDDYRIGLAMFGSLLPFGAKPSWGATRRKMPNVEITEYEDGRRTTVTKGASRTVVQLAWTEGINQWPLLGDTPSPSWYGSHSETGLGNPMVAREDTPGHLWGLLDEVGGAAQVLAWVRSVDVTDIPSGPGFDVTYNDAGRCLPVRWVGGVEISSVMNRNDSAVETVATITLEEEL